MNEPALNIPPEPSGEIEMSYIPSEKLTMVWDKAKKYLKKYSLKDTVDLILESEKVNKKEIYKLCLKVKNEKNY